MEHLYINDIKPGQQINEIYMISQPVLRNTTRGDLYIAMFLSDKTGKVNARMWQATESIYNQLPSEGFLQIRGKSELYQGALQVIINDMVVVDSGKVSLDDYMPKTEKDIAKMFAEVKQMAAKIKDPAVKVLVDEFLNDTQLMQQFCTAPAAMQMHHSYIGGLLEHTHSMLCVATNILPLYPKLQADIVLAAIFLHDIAKTCELSYDCAFSYTDTGQLVGHIVQGATMIKEKAQALAKKGTAIDKTILDHLLHIVVSHHGQYNFGSPKLPATAEAFMVSRLDDLDAKMNQVTNLIEGEQGEGDWTSYQRPLETRLYRKRAIE